MVSDNTYIDNGAAMVGHWLMDRGFKVGMIAQSDVSSGEEISRLGSPDLMWSVLAGCVDSMVTNYISAKNFCKEDDFSLRRRQ